MTAVPAVAGDRAVALEASGISKSFGGVAALDGVGLALRPGEVLGLAGANGAGKSTLIKILTGQLRPDAGSLTLGGEAVVLTSPREAQRAGIGVVAQELDLVPDLTIAENIYLGEESRFTRRGRLDRRAMVAAARSLLTRVGVTEDPATEVRDVSIGDRQLVAAARALRHAGSVLLLDEPTSSLTPFEAERLFGVIRALADSGVAVVFISHRLNEVSTLCDRVVVLRDGRLAGEYDARDLPAIVEAMVPGTAAMETHARAGRSGAPLFTARGIGIKGRAPLDLEIGAGEIVGVFGLVGAGKTSLGQAIAGLLRLDQGEMNLGGTAYRPRSATRAHALGVAMLSEDRRGEGILPGLSVRENLVVRAPSGTTRAGVFRASAVRDVVDRAVERLRIKTASDRLDIRDLSGGNQQKVLVGRLLADEPRLLVLDEPTHGIDVRAKHDLLTRVVELADRGMGVLMISSEIPELLATADRVLVMRTGRIVAETTAATADERQLMAAATGGDS